MFKMTMWMFDSDNNALCAVFSFFGRNGYIYLLKYTHFLYQNFASKMRALMTN